MINRLTICVILLLCGAAYGQTYCGFSDDKAIHTPPNYTTFAPSGTIGYTWNDQAFGCQITELTNAVTAGHPWHHQHTQQEPFNADDSLIFILDDGGGWYIIAGPVTNSNNNNKSIGTMIVNTSNFPSMSFNGPIWDGSNPLVFYAATGNTVYKATVNPSAGTVSTTTVATATGFSYVCMSGATFASDIDNSNKYFGVLLETGGTGCYGGGPTDYKMSIVNVITGTFTSCTTGADCDMGTSQPHGWITTPDSYIMVNPNTGPFNGGNFIWTGTTPHETQQTAVHTDLGYKGSTEVMILEREADSGLSDACPTGYGVDYASNIYNYPSLSLSCLYDIYTGTGSAVYPGVGPEVSFRNEYGGSPWVIVSLFDNGRTPSPEWYTADANWAGTNWANYWGKCVSPCNSSSNGGSIYEGEVDAININTGQVLRLAHSRSRADESYWAISRATPSHDGKYILFDSNMLVANNSTENTMTDYGDVYMITFQTAAGSACGTGTGFCYSSDGTCSNTGIQDAINGYTGQAAAADGDTIVVPAGTCPWTTTVTGTHNFHIIGAGQGTTILVDKTVKSTPTCAPMLSISATTNTPFEMANMTIQGYSPDADACTEHILLYTYSHAMRIHSVTFDDQTNAGTSCTAGGPLGNGGSYCETGIFIDGDAWGVLDHNIFLGARQRSIHVMHENFDNDVTGGWGDNSWAQPDSLGGQQAVFAETNSFTTTDQNGTGNMSCAGGARCVFRYNSGAAYLASHGNDTGQRRRSIRQFEAYNNTFTDAAQNQGAISQIINLRGGTAMVFNNTFTAMNYSGSYSTEGTWATENYRDPDAWTPWGIQPGNCATNGTDCAGGCDGTTGWDNNGTAGIVSSTVTSGNGTTYCTSGATTDCVVDTTQNWTTDQWVGYSLRDLTQVVGTPNPRHWGSVIQHNSANAIVTYPTIGGIATHTVVVGDSYEINSIGHCIDQVGRGQGIYISGGSYTSEITNPSIPTPLNQVIDPIYEWGNTRFNSSGPSPGLFPVTAPAAYYSTAPPNATGHIQQNREYYRFQTNGFGVQTFNGTVGTGMGFFSAMPSTCTPSVGYWATDQNILYVCTSTNTWTNYYTPYTYPHPLTLSFSSVINGSVKIRGNTVVVK